MTAAPAILPSKAWLTTLRELQQAWQEKYPNQERGGRVALSVFTSQFDVLLHDLVRAWLDSKDKSFPGVFTEVLSDVAKVKTDGLLITQVKRRQVVAAAA